MLAAAGYAQVAPEPRNPFRSDVGAIEAGRGIYNKTCTACHGANGAGGEFAPGLAVSGRIYANRTDAAVFSVIRNGIPGTAMPPHGDRLTVEQIWKVTAYIIGLRGTAIDAPAAGDVAHGRQVFEGKGQCSECHMIAGRGGIIGPDLSNIASVRKSSSLLDALTKANNRIYPPGGAQPHELTPLEAYPVVTITNGDGTVIRGVLRNEDSYSLQVLGLDEKLYLFDRSKLRSVVYETSRLMPSDYDKRLTPTEFADLMAFLTRQSTSRGLAR
jgi:putative heme-binding domain-containing protein